MAGHSQWANIKHRKAAQDKKRGKIFQKILRQLQVAVKQGGINLETNNQLRLIIEKAKSVNMPKDNIDRALKRFIKDDASNYEEVVYEGYGSGKVAIMIECLTDNRNRTAANIRSYFNKNNGSLAINGAVRYLFTKCGLLVFTDDQLTEADLWEWLIDLPINDLQSNNHTFIITTDVNNFWEVKNFFLTKAIQNFDVSEIIFQPEQLVSVTDTTELKQFWNLINLLEDDEDVQNIYHNLQE